MKKKKEKRFASFFLTLSLIFLFFCVCIKLLLILYTLRWTKIYVCVLKFERSRLRRLRDICAHSIILHINNDVLNLLHRLFMSINVEMIYKYCFIRFASTIRSFKMYFKIKIEQKKSHSPETLPISFRINWG